ncbi:MAG: hypothetical protein K0S23_1583 [Fluviicola sp.]|jgi:gas vesicle protein|nr:hypothetical protein [Fluviicola sp.]
MDQGLKLAGRIFKFIIKKSINMKTGEDKMKNDGKSGNTSRIVGSLVAGAAVGLAAGILLAPEKGKKTRAKLMDDAKDLTNKLKDKANDFKDKASNFKDQASDHIEEKANEIKDKANDLKDKASDGIDAVTANLKSS